MSLESGEQPGLRSVARAVPSAKDGDKPVTNWSWWPNPADTVSDATDGGDAMEEFRSLPESVMGELLCLMKRLIDGDSRANLDDRAAIKQVIHASGAVDYRILFCVHADSFVVLTSCGTDCSEAVERALALAESRRRRL